MQKRVPSAAVELLLQPDNCDNTCDRTRVLRRFFAHYFRQASRSFPWREPGVGPFHLLLAELLLVQTKAVNVVQTWQTLVQAYPDVKDIAAAKEQTLVRLLRPLGLQRQRARALKAVCKAVMSKHAGVIPSDPGDLLALPHVGLYVAAAVRAFAFRQRTPIVDGNVLRVLGRVVGADFRTDTRRAPDAWRLAWSILPKRKPQMHNYGLLDFAAQICSRTPQCGSCGVARFCEFYKRTRSD